MENSAEDLISRERLKKMIKATKKRAESFASQAYWTGYAVALSTLEGVLADEPTVDAAPVVHGRWSEKQEATSWCDDDVFVFYECSVCHDQDGIYIDKFSYCPNCGARMDEEANKE